ncbi:MAG: alpha/beta-type small acid-soluble spore protein [Firmicutes bacterium]|nr:alpha/beta-type small acid-soluble spore protein [Bacillota bacterium]
MGRRNAGRSRVLVPAAQQALEDFKLEIANEIGLTNYQEVDKGELTSRQNGYVGGYMVRKMIQQVEDQLANGTIQASQLTAQPAPKSPVGTNEFL